MQYIAVALHNTGHGPIATVICASESPLDPITAARNAEELGYQFYDNDTGVCVFTLMDGEYVFKDQLKYLTAKPPENYPIVYSRTKRDGVWVEEWLDEELKRELANENFDLPPDVKP